MEKFYSLWKDFVSSAEHKNKPSQLQENLEILNEISRDVSDKIYKWMRDASVMDYSFDELFDGKMRMAMPFDSEDALNLKKVVRVLKKDGWKAGELVPWEGGMHTSNKFPTRKVKQKRQRLADEGGGFYEQEIEVADLGLAKSYEKEIPAGPRKGEVIQRTDKLGMGKAIAKLVKEKKLDKDLLDWWHKKQTYYTKDNNWNEIEGLFSGDEVDYTVIISRHPVDVLRMSDIGSIQSCHSEGRSHFQCAVAEAKGHGPIAYLVPTTMYEMLMSGLYEEDRKSSSLDKDTAESKLLKAHAALQAEEHIKAHYFPEFRLNTIYKHRMDAESLEGALKTIESDRSVSNAYNELRTEVRALLTDQAILDAVISKVEGEEWSLADFHELNPDEKEPEKIGDISEFDDKEIFRDNQRRIKGMVAKGRVRFRKFEDEDTGLQFVGVEHRTYGAVPPGFVKSMNKWAAESQEEAFREAGYLDEDNHAPNWYSLTRYGGSYEDTNDSDVLGDLFRYYDPDFTSYDGGYNVNRNDEEEQEDLAAEYEQRVDELNDYAANQLGHVGTYAEVGEYDDDPHVHASADLMIELNLLGWDGLMEDYGSNYYQSRGADEDGNPYIIPKSWGGDYQKRRTFENALEAKIDVYSEEIEWDVNVQKGGAIGEEGSTTVLEVRLRFSMEDGYTPDDYENFIDYLKSDVDDKYENIREGIRLALVEEGYMLRNYFDKLNYAATEDDEGNEIEAGPTPAQEFAGNLQHFEFYPPSDDGDGEMLFVSRGPGKVNYITTPTMMPASLRKHDRATGWTVADLETAFGGKRFSLGFGTPPSVKHTGLGMHKIAMALGDIQKEAEAHAGKQLSLDFGETYEAPPDQQVLPDFAKNVEFITVLATPTASQQAGLPETDDKDSRHLGFGIRVKILSVDSEREIKGAIAFMEYVDKEIRTIARAFQSLWEPAIDEAVETKEKAQAAAVSKGTMEQLTNALDTKVRNMLNTPRPGDPSYQPPLVAILKAYIEWAHTAWPEMDLLERRTLINQYLRPLQQGSLGTSAGNFEPNSSGSSYAPLHWHRAVKQSHREAGAPEAVWGRYGWSGPNFRKILEKHRAENPDRETAQAEQEAAIEAERQSWADALDQNDAEEYAQRVPVPEEPIGLARLGTALDQGGGGPVVRRGEPSHLEAYEDDIRESLRYAIKRAIYGKGENYMASDKIAKEAKQLLKEWQWLQNQMADAFLEDDERERYYDDIETEVASEEARAAGLRGVPDPDYELPGDSRPPIFHPAGSPMEHDSSPISPAYLRDRGPEFDQDILPPFDLSNVPEVDYNLDWTYNDPNFEEDFGVSDPGWGRDPTPQELEYLRFRQHYGDDDYLNTYERSREEAVQSYMHLEDYVLNNHPQFGFMGDEEQKEYYRLYDIYNTVTPEEFVQHQTSMVPRNTYTAPLQIGQAPSSDANPYRITSYSAPRRITVDGETRTQDPHGGFDIGNTPTGTPLSAPLPGRVVGSGWAGSAGNYIDLMHVDPYTGLPFTGRYFHMHQRSPLRRGDFVEAGETIGGVGSTGKSSGPHLHYEEWGTTGTQRPDQTAEQQVTSIWPWYSGDGTEPSLDSTNYYTDIAGNLLTPAQRQGRLVPEDFNTGDPALDASMRGYLAHMVGVSTGDLPDRINARTLQNLLGDDAVMTRYQRGFGGIGRGNYGARSNAYEYRLREWDPTEFNLRMQMADAAEQVLSSGTPQIDQGAPAYQALVAAGFRPDFDPRDLETMVNWRDNYLYREAMLESGGFDPLNYTPEQLQAMSSPFNFRPEARLADPDRDYYRRYSTGNTYTPPPPPAPASELQESKGRNLADALREAIKIKLSSNTQGCETCGEMHGPEEMCELPTLEEVYVQNVYELRCGINIHKQKGGNRDQTLTDIRGIPGVTIVSVVPGQTKELPHTFITTLSIKFEMNRNLPARDYVKKTLIPALQKVPGISHFKVKTVNRISTAEDEV